MVVGDVTTLDIGAIFTVVGAIFIILCYKCTREYMTGGDLSYLGLAFTCLVVAIFSSMICITAYNMPY